jgi:hypothetical protein
VKPAIAILPKPPTGKKLAPFYLLYCPLGPDKKRDNITAPPEPSMLKSIIENNNRTSLSTLDKARARNSIAGDNNSTDPAPRQQERFVTDILRLITALDNVWSAIPSTIAARQNNGTLPPGDE